MTVVDRMTVIAQRRCTVVTHIRMVAQQSATQLGKRDCTTQLNSGLVHSDTAGWIGSFSCLFVVGYTSLYNFMCGL